MLNIIKYKGKRYKAINDELGDCSLCVFRPAATCPMCRDIYSKKYFIPKCIFNDCYYVLHRDVNKNTKVL